MRRPWSIVPVALVLGLVGGGVVAAAEPDRHDWAQYNYDVRGWRFNRAETRLSPENAGRLVEKWRYPAAGSEEVVGVIHATPIVVQGFVYFGTIRTDPAFYKLSPRGKLVWKYPIRSEMTRENGDPYALYGLRANAEGIVPDGVLNAALVTDRHVFFGTFGGLIICLDRFTGQEVWKVNTKRPPFPGAHGANTVMSAPILADGKLIVAGGAFEHVLGALPGYDNCTGRGFVAAFQPATGQLVWKYDVGPPPKKLDPPVVIETASGRKVRFRYGPSTSSVWCTPSYDAETKTLFFGTDTHNSPRQPTPDDARLYNKYSCAIIAISVEDGSEKWVRQLCENDVWNNSLPGWDPKTGQYKDQTIGDTPKIYDAVIEGRRRKVVGAGCKNGSFYVLDRMTGELLVKTPTYTGSPDPELTATAATRILALPSLMGGLQTGCAFDGQRIYVNGTDWLGMVYSSSRQQGRYPPSGGRVTALRPHALAEFWRHERPKTHWQPDSKDAEPMLSGDPVASGIAVANGILAFTTTVSGKLVVLRTSDGRVLKEIDLGPVWCGPSISRGRIYVGSGNTLFEPWEVAGRRLPQGRGFHFPLKPTGTLYCFGLPGEDDVDRLPESETSE